MECITLGMVMGNVHKHTVHRPEECTKQSRVVYKNGTNSLLWCLSDCFRQSPFEQKIILQPHSHRHTVTPKTPRSAL